MCVNSSIGKRVLDFHQKSGSPKSKGRKTMSITEKQNENAPELHKPESGFVKSPSPFLDKIYKKARKVKVISKIHLANPRLDFQSKRFEKEFEFLDGSTNDFTNVSWPKVTKNAGTFEPSSKVSQLGRLVIGYLNELGFIKATATSMPTSDDEAESEGSDNVSKQYFCDLEFAIRYKSEKFCLKLFMAYNQRGSVVGKIPSGLYITDEELLEYLKDKLIFKRHENADSNRKIQKLMYLDSIRCFINDLELDLV